MPAEGSEIGIATASTAGCDGGMDSLLEYLDDWTERQPDHSLYTFLNGSGKVVERYTYSQFQRRTNYVAARLAESGCVEFGRPVLLAYDPGLEFIVAFFACMKLGALPVPVSPPGAGGFLSGLGKLALIATDAGATSVLTTSKVYRRVLDRMEREDDSVTSTIRALSWIETEDWRKSESQWTNQIHELAFLQYTSGSTQAPRGVMVSQRNLVCNGHALVDHCPCAISWLPHYHDMGLIGCHLYSMLLGGSMVAFSDVTFMRRPSLWLEAITRFGGTISPAPNFAFAYLLHESVLRKLDFGSLDLQSMRCMMNGAEPVSCETMSRFAAQFEPCGLSPDALSVAYGLAENTLAVTHSGRRQLTADRRYLSRGELRIVRDGQVPASQIQVASCGRPLAGTDVRIVDAESCRELNDGEIGEIWINGDGKTQGYWMKPELSRATFEAEICNRDDQSRYLRTGDLGFLQDGELFVCGRLKDVIICRGKNYYSHDIESVVERHISNGRPGNVAAFAVENEDQGDTLAIIAEVKPRKELPDVESICVEVRRLCQLNPSLLAFVAPGSIARTSSGKIARHECKRRWLAGEMKALAIHQANPSGRSEDSLQSMLDMIDSPEMQDLTLAEAGIDSLSLVSLSLHIKRKLEADGVTSADELTDLKMLQAMRVGDLKRELERALRDEAVGSEHLELYADRLQSIDEREQQMMRQDSQWATDVQPSAVLPSAVARENRRVLLTGATGFFGGFLLDALLRLSDYEVVLLVRAADHAHGMQRIESALRRTTSAASEMLESLGTRVRVLIGDLERPLLGLSAQEWKKFEEDIDAIYHCGATVDYVKPYEALRSANVEGVRELLRLACSGRRKSFHLVSTTFIFGWSAPDVLLESDRNRDMEDLDFGYAQTKWVAEQLVYQAGEQGLPVSVYRPSLITASRNAKYVRRDITARLLTYMIRHGMAFDCENQVSFLPADVAADNLVAISMLNDRDAANYHIVADNYYPFRSVTESISRQFGYPFEYASIASFVDHLNRNCVENDLMYPLVPFFNKNHQKMDHMRKKRYDSTNYKMACRRSSLSVTEPALDETVAAIVQFLLNEKLIPPVPCAAVSSADQAASKS